MDKSILQSTFAELESNYSVVFEVDFFREMAKDNDGPRKKYT